MKKQLAFIAVASLTAGLLFTGCDKDTNETTAPTVQSDTQQQQQETLSYTDMSKYRLETVLKNKDTTTAYTRSSCTLIKMSDDNTVVEGNGATCKDNIISITQSGDYLLEGELTDGQICVRVADTEDVRLIFNGITISNSKTAPIYIEEADKVIITLASDSTNSISDSERATTESEDLTGAIYSKADLTINGDGKLNIEAGYKDGITSKDDLKICGGSITINSADDGMVGKDLLQITGGVFNINAKGDGLKSTNDTDADKGNVLITDGTFVINAGNDGIQAENILQTDGGAFDITTGEGSANVNTSQGGMDFGGMHGGNRFPQGQQSTTTDTESFKGIKATDFVGMYGGTYDIDSEDDGVHSDGSLYIKSGSLEISAGDDGLHCEASLYIDGGTVNITKSYEGIEGMVITVNGGNVSITAGDDGFNAAGGTSAYDNMMMGRPGNTSAASSYQLNVNGGDIYVNAGGDGFDSNGVVNIADGVIKVDGPSNAGNSALDYESSFNVTGGDIIAVGTSGMAEGITSVNNVTAIAITLSGYYKADSEIKLTDEDGNIMSQHTAIKQFNHLIFCSEELKADTKYILYIDGEEVVSFTTVANNNSVDSNGNVTQSTGHGSSQIGPGNPGGGDHGGGAGGNRGDKNDMWRPGNQNNITPPDGMNIPEGMTRPDMGNIPSPEL